MPFSSIGRRIRSARQQSRLTQVSVAQRLGVSSQAISQWERDEHLPGLERLADLAKVLSTNVEWLARGTGVGIGGAIVEGNSRGRRVTLTSIAKLGLSMSATEYAEVQFPTGPNAQAIILNDSSMEPEFRAGDIVVVDPDIEPLPGDFVCVLVRASQTHVFRRYRLVPSGKAPNEMTIELAALNPDWPVLALPAATRSRFAAS